MISPSKGKFIKGSESGAVLIVVLLVLVLITLICSGIIKLDSF